MFCKQYISNQWGLIFLLFFLIMSDIGLIYYQIFFFPYHLNYFREYTVDSVTYHKWLEFLHLLKMVCNAVIAKTFPRPPITKTIKVRRTRHAGQCWRSRDELISYVLLWTASHGWAKPGRPARTYIQQLCEDMGYSPEDLPEAMNDREEWWERVRDIRAV